MTRRRKIEITERNCEDWIFEKAWERSGFENKETLYEEIRGLSVEEKVELLSEVFINDMAKVYFTKKGEFMRKLGKKTWVDSNEAYEHALSVYDVNYKDNEIDWQIDRISFYPHHIDNELKYTELNLVGISRLKKETNSE